MLIKNLKITYISGKENNHLVPVLIPDDTSNTLLKLSGPVIRGQAGIEQKNRYLFEYICMGIQFDLTKWEFLSLL